MNRERISRQFRTIAIAVMCASAFYPQAAAQSTAPLQSAGSTQANSIVSRAINALGGIAAWRGISAATAQVQLTSGAKTETIAWSDDWHLGYMQSRRDSANAAGASTSVITSEFGRVYSVQGGTPQSLPREGDLTVMAEGYPGAALVYSVASTKCSFTMGTIPTIRIDTVDSLATAQDEKVEEVCLDPQMPTGRSTLTWIFSSASALPVAVKLPVKGFLHNSTQYQTVVFQSFQSVQGVLVPKTLSVRRPYGTTDELTVSNTTLTSTLPASTFQSAN